MLTKIIYRTSRIKPFENLDLLNEYLDVQKLPMNLVYFRAAWNPACVLTDQHIQQFSLKHPIEIIKIESDVSRRIAEHYGVRAEP